MFAQLLRRILCAGLLISSYISGIDIILESPVIKLIDGMSIGIDGQRIGFMLQVRRTIRNIQGKAGQGKSTGRYLFQGMLYGIEELARIERQAILEQNTAILEQLATLLLDAKKDFLQEVATFMSTARGTKQQMLMLIEESCFKRKRFDSLLLRWGAAQEGCEEQQFHNDMINFDVFNTFCNDLVNFLEDLMRSCPKGMEQFKQLLKK